MKNETKKLSPAQKDVLRILNSLKENPRPDQERPEIYGGHKGMKDLFGIDENNKIIDTCPLRDMTKMEKMGLIVRVSDYTQKWRNHTGAIHTTVNSQRDITWTLPEFDLPEFEL